MGYKYIPTFGELIYYLHGYSLEEFFDATAKLLSPDGLLVKNTLNKMGIENFTKLKPVSLEFVNYGIMQVIFRVTLELNNEKEISFIAAFSQMDKYVNEVKEEYENLLLLYSKYPNLVNKSFSYGSIQIEKFKTLCCSTSLDLGYCNCVYRRPVNRNTKEMKWGLCVPLPEYHFEIFEENLLDEQFYIPLPEFCRRLMIATLIAIYDHKNEIGLAGTRFCGDDFVLLSGFSFSKLKKNDFQLNKNNLLDQDNNKVNNKKSKNEITSSILKSWRLIAARKLIHIPYQDYLKLIKKEFQEETFMYQPRIINREFIINHKSGQAFSENTIQEGIKLGILIKEMGIWNK
ncbi:hypothetical protein M0813_21582 [Anaeramoeba flamelloides]|uniref:Uncharacterized protein n=1 Tax=Anaeramoeba flamelloides TaxID=1746091 RepID=A0ABQ8YIC7_9EUKA|nr:hypothetical protein M0813_21582 [Anaeramoeba flamelloides]